MLAAGRRSEYLGPTPGWNRGTHTPTSTGAPGIMATIELTIDNFEQTINDNDTVFVDFWA